jgi:hypothetical protein
MCRLLLLFCASSVGATCVAQATFQQRADHTINVRLDDEAHVLHGEETLRYTNNSPKALDTLWLHLWPNAYAQPNTALDKQLVGQGKLDLHFATPEERGGIDSLDFRDANDTKLSWGYHPQHSDIAWVKLAASVLPGTSTTLRTPFRVKIPDGKFSRLGHTGQAYYITQWFPKPAVYDEQGWHTMPYLTQGEFFCEFGRYDVSITLPANYVVGATGMLQNSAEQAWMDSLAAVPYADPRRFKVEFQRKALNAFPASAQRTKTLRYVQDNVHDFAWFADKRFIVRKDVATLPDSKRSVTVWALFTPKNAEEWEAIGTRSLVNSLIHYSEWLGDYPYEACTAVDGTISAGGGMEYPMITIIGDMGNEQMLDNVIAHEVGHNWFQGILASNERDHPWMDEGMNSFVELIYMRRHYAGSSMSSSIPGLSKELKFKDPHRMQSELGYRMNARRNLDQGLCLHSAHYTGTNYGTNVYMKSALAFDHLLAYLGEADMKRCMRGYYAEFKFRHPAPADVQRVFERESDKDLNWLFKGFLCTDEKYRVKAVSLDRRLQGGTEERMHLGHRAKGPSKVPFPITGYLGADSLGTVWDWNHGFGHKGRTEYAPLPWPEVDRVRIDADERTLDIDRRNNTVRSSGLFKRTAAPRFKFLAGLEQQDRGSVFFTPAIAANGHDGLQVGLLLHNTTFPSQRTEWVLAPLYGLGSEHLGGAARIEHHFDRLRSRIFQNIHVGLSARSASTFHDHFAHAWYTKVQPSVRFDIKRDPLSKPWSHSITVRGVHLASGDRIEVPEAPSITRSEERTYAELSYTAQDRYGLSPTSVTPEILVGNGMARAAVEVRQAFTYNDRKDQLRLRLFAGTFLSKDERGLRSGLEAWGLSWGPEDLLFDHAYLERGATERLLSRQFTKQQGGFKTPFLQGGSDTWMAALNLEFDLPIGIPRSLFASAGAVPLTRITPDGRTTSTAGYAEAGIGLQLMRDVIEVWVPLYVSERIADEEDFLARGIADRIRFVFALEKLDPTRLLRRVRA